MRKPFTILAIAALLVGLLFGYLWWGSAWSPTRKEAEQAQARLAETERRREDAEAGRQAAEEKIKALDARVQTLETDLAQERERRSRLEGILSEGRK